MGSRASCILNIKYSEEWIHSVDFQQLLKSKILSSEYISVDKKREQSASLANVYVDRIVTLRCVFIPPLKISQTYTFRVDTSNNFVSRFIYEYDSFIRDRWDYKGHRELRYSMDRVLVLVVLVTFVYSNKLLTPKKRPGVLSAS